MIKSTHPDFERLIAGQPVRPTSLLVDFLDEIGLQHRSEGGLLLLDNPPELIDEARVAGLLTRHLSQVQRSSLALEVHRTISSTNDVAMQRLEDPRCEHLLCTAEMQTAGRGRRGRHWISPFGRNVYLSYGRFVGRELGDLGGLSLVVGMQTVDVLREFGLKDVALKWPNDLLLGSGKMGGILVELKAGERRGIGIVAGVGINLALNEKDAASIDQPWSSAEGHALISRNELLGLLTARLVRGIDLFDREGFAPFHDRWADYNSYAGQPISVIRGEEIVHGIDGGVDKAGNLLLETVTGVQAHNSGEVSMRPVAEP